MIQRGRWRLGAAVVGVVCFGFGMFQFAAALKSSARYDQLSSEVQGRAAGGKGAEPRALGMVLRVLADLRHDTHERLARGLFGAAGGMTLMALGGQGLLAERRRASLHLIGERLRVADEPAARPDGRCASATTPRLDALDDEEMALLARFDALEQRASLERMGRASTGG